MSKEDVKEISQCFIIFGYFFQASSVFSVVTQRSSCGEERCVTTLKTAV